MLNLQKDINYVSVILEELGLIRAANEVMFVANYEELQNFISLAYDEASNQARDDIWFSGNLAVAQNERFSPNSYRIEVEYPYEQ